MATMPVGTVTYLMTDVEGSTRLWELYPEAMAQALPRHEQIADDCTARYGGTRLKERGEGDSLFIVFGRPADALKAAVDLQLGLAGETWPEGIDLKVRAAVHTGDAWVRDQDYYGPAVIRCARLRGIANGGQILVSQATQQLVGNGLPDGAVFRDLGTHRLKDLLRPERVAELSHPSIPSTAAPLASLNRVQNNLPIQLTSFVGRQDQVLQISEKLKDARLVTLLGSGGSGKTRLSLQIAAESFEQFPDGIWFFDLTKIARDEEVVPFLAQTLSIPAVEGKDRIQALIEALQGRRCVLLLDNCEHVADGVADAVTHLLQATQETVVLATSRMALRVAGETRFQVPCLSLPARGDSPEQIARSEAVALFTERARGAEASFTLDERMVDDVVQLCRLLDGIPLAIEQAASHASILSPKQMVRRFKDQLKSLKSTDRNVPQRHQTLRATIDWSYGMLTEQEQLCFARCSVFNGGWTLEACEAVCGDDRLNSEDIPDTLQSLLDKSLIFTEETSHGEPRLRMLRVLKEYAIERLGSAEELIERHACWVHAAAVEQAVEQSWSRFEVMVNEIPQAMDWLIPNSPLDALSCVLGLRRFLLNTGRVREGRDWLLRCLQADAAFPDVDLARAFNTLGAYRSQLGEVEEASVSYRQSLQIWDRLGDVTQQATVRHNLGLLLASMERYEEAREMLAASLEQHRALGDAGGVSTAVANLGRVEMERGDLESAVQLLREGQQMALRLHGRAGAAKVTMNLAEAHVRRGDLAEGITTLRFSICEWLELPNRTSIVTALLILSYAAAQAEIVEQARRLLRAAEALADQLGIQFSAGERSLHALAIELLPPSFPTAGAAFGSNLDLEAHLTYALRVCDELLAASR